MVRSEKELLAFNTDDVQEAFKYQQQNNLWNFYNEREFVEILLSQRFNYLILVYSLFVSAVATVYNLHPKILLVIVFLLGTIVVRLICITIFRIYAKVIINLDILDCLGGKHVFHFIRKETKARKIKYSYANKILGVYMPNFCFYTMLLGLFFSVIRIIFDF